MLHKLRQPIPHLALQRTVGQVVLFFVPENPFHLQANKASRSLILVSRTCNALALGGLTFRFMFLKLVCVQIVGFGVVLATGKIFGTDHKST